MSVDIASIERGVREGELEYRSLSNVAVVSLGLSILSCLALLDWIWVVVPALGLLSGLYALRSINRRSDELSGLGLAKTGTALSLAFLLLGPAWLGYAYAHEVPTGHDRVSYDVLQPEPKHPANEPPAAALALDGKKVFIKGYVYPGADAQGIRTFLLVRDQGDCCFGGDPKITDRIQVTLNDPLRLKYDKAPHGVGGVFHVRPTKAVNGPGGVIYQIDGDYLK